jgi:hypothetical protein
VVTERLENKAQSLLVNLDDKDLDTWDHSVTAMNAQFHITQDELSPG